MTQKRIKQEWKRFQIIGSVFFSFVMIVIAVIGLSTGTQARYSAETAQQRYSVQTFLQSSGGVPVVDEDKPQTIYYDVPLSQEVQDYIFSITKIYGVPCDVVIAIINRETNYCADVTGMAGECGYMQIHPINFEWLTNELGVTDFYDPEQNILCGVYMLSCLYDKYNTTAEVLMCYNCGEAGAKRLWAQGCTSTEYTRDVLAHIEALKLTGGDEK